MTTIEPVDRLESVLERVEAYKEKTFTIRQTLVEVYRISKRGFTNSEALYWADRLESLISAVSE